MKKTMIVDDDIYIGNLIEEALTKNGYLELLKTGEKIEEVARCLAIIENRTEAIKKLTTETFFLPIRRQSLIKYRWKRFLTGFIRWKMQERQLVSVFLSREALPSE